MRFSDEFLRAHDLFVCFYYSAFVAVFTTLGASGRFGPTSIGLVLLLLLLFFFFGFCFFIIDVDECTASSSMCHENAFCNNTLGSYNCTCKPGYYGDGKTCKGKIGRCLHHSSFQSLTGRDVNPRFVSAKLGINGSDDLPNFKFFK